MAAETLSILTERASVFAFTGSVVSETGKGDSDENDSDQGRVCAAEHLPGRHSCHSAATAECEGHVGIPAVCSHSLQEVRKTAVKHWHAIF